MGLSLRVNFDAEEEKKIEALKKKYGLKQATELVRLIITLHYEMLQKEGLLKASLS